MLQALTVLFLCQLAGEVAVRILGLTFPGPVLGMALLFWLLILRGGTGPNLGAVTDTILRNLTLLFVPATVGVMTQGKIFAENWVAIVTALIVSTILVLIVTVLTFRGVALLQERVQGRHRA